MSSMEYRARGVQSKLSMSGDNSHVRSPGAEHLHFCTGTVVRARNIQFFHVHVNGVQVVEHRVVCEKILF